MKVKVYRRADMALPPSYLVVVDDRMVYILPADEYTPPVVCGELHTQVKNVTAGMVDMALVPGHLLPRIADAILLYANQYGVGQ